MQYYRALGAMYYIRCYAVLYGQDVEALVAGSDVCMYICVNTIVS